MGGDHKCPVCQATFTRPQHVARHMRSHTGDRPYKCQYCGDQFARSDLLSRHVNKCHANEKPLVNTATRRKGSASTSRATTSKQACDQCVQSSLPCDGSNPCSKCVQRKARCTYVKFHRQTAPVGPGHNPRPVGTTGPSPSVHGSGVGGSSVSPTTTSRYPIYSEDFATAPSGSSPTAYAPQQQVSAAIHEALYPQGTTFPFAPLYSTSSAEASAADYAGKYSRAQDDLYRSSSATMPGGSAPGSAPSSWVGNAASIASGWPQGSSHQQDVYHHPQQHQLERHAYAQPPSLVPSQQHDEMPMYIRGQDDSLTAPSFREIFAEDFAPRRGPASDSGYAHASDTTDGSGSESGYYAATSSSSRGRKRYYDDDNLHSAGGMDQPSPFSFDPHQTGTRDSSTSSSSRYQHHPPQYPDSGSVSDRPGSTSSQHQHQHPPPPGTASSTTSSTAGHHPAGTAGTFFNDFGSLTLDDANVLAGLAAGGGGGAAGGAPPDGSSFFAHMNIDQLSAAAAAAGVPFPPPPGSHPQQGDDSADPDATPMPIKEEEGSAGRSGSSEVDDLMRRALRRSFDGQRIQRPLSSLAALPSASAGLNWSSYLGLGTPAGSTAGFGGPTGWTPGGYGAALAGLGEVANSSSSGGMGVGQGVGMTPGKEMDPKELKEFWKQYLKTPLTTAGGNETLGTDAEQRSLGGGGEAAIAGAMASPHRTRPRVASMPSSKTPMVERGNLHYPPPGASGLGPTSSMRTTLNPSGSRVSPQKKDDLASYEAAVLARKTPINLSMNRLSSRRRGGNSNPSAAAAGSGGAGAASGGYSQNSGHSVGGTGREIPISGSSMAKEVLFHNRPRNVGSDDSSGSAGASPMSRASSLSVDDGSSRPGSSAGMNGMLKPQRPTAKRLASSVLESGTAKAMKFDTEGGDAGTHGGAGSALPQPPALGSMVSLPPLSTQNLDPYRHSGGVGGAGGNTMMGPPPPSSAPPQAGSMLNMNLSRTGPGPTLAERRRMSVASMMSDAAGVRNRRMSDAR